MKMLENEKSILKSKVVVKRILEIMLLALWLYAGSAVLHSIQDSKYYNANEDETVVRVIANSNHQDDQLVKQSIANEIMESTDNPSTLTVGDAVIEEAFPDVEWKLASGSYLMPPKLTNNQFFPQQNRDMVQVSIGNARGDNWFCALFYKACGYSSKKEMEKKKTNKKKKKKSRKKWGLF
jgi:stage II sporulation protein R